MNKIYDVFLFDLDGTISDTSPGIIKGVLYALKMFGIEETDSTRLYKMIGPPLWYSFEQFYGFSREKALEAVKYYREYYTEKGIYDNCIYDGLKDVVNVLKEAGKILAVATSKPEPFAKTMIEQLGLTPYFNYVVGMELDGGRGTKAEVIRYALEACGIQDKSKVLMIGDREYDVIGASEVGVDSLGILYGYGTREELKKAGATYIVETVEEILNFR